jgi:hypothetical protein
MPLARSSFIEIDARKSALGFRVCHQKIRRQTGCAWNCSTTDVTDTCCVVRVICRPASYETELDALAAGAKLFADRNERHWASQPEIVARIRTFIKESIPWHLSGMWEDNPREVVTCLCRCVLDGSVVILRAEPAYIAHSGFVPMRQYDTRHTKRTLPNAPAAMQPGRKRTGTIFKRITKRLMSAPREQRAR